MYILNGRESKSGLQWQIDLTWLATGSLPRKVVPRGRPKLLTRLWPGLERATCGMGRYSAKVFLGAFNNFWWFLDDLEAMSRIVTDVSELVIEDLTWEEFETVWRHFIDYIRSQPPESMSPKYRYVVNNAVVRVVRNAFEAAKDAGETEREYLDVYVALRDSRKSVYGGDTLDYDEVRNAFKSLATAWRRVIRRGEQARERAVGDDYGKVDLIAEGLRLAMHGDCCKLDEYLTGIDKVSLPAELQLEGVDTVINGFPAYQACVFLSRNHLAIALAMVTMKTGMNPDAITRMRVDQWCHPDSLMPQDRVVVYGPKRKGNYNLTAVSYIRKPTDPYQIISNIIKIQAPLRERLRLEAEVSGNAELLERSRLVWVFSDARGCIRDLAPRGGPNDDLSNALSDIDGLFDRVGLKRKDGKPLRYRFTDGRDIWGLFVYHRSGFNHILTAQALGHGTLTSLLHYLEKRVTMIEDRKRQIDLHGRVLDDLRKGRFDPRAYRRDLAQPLDVAADALQAATGLLCTSPTDPDPEADPSHREGQLCKSQGCWACTKWYATVESVPYLLRIIEDLEDIRNRVSAALWTTSDWMVMGEIYRHILSKFHHSVIRLQKGKAKDLPPIVTMRMFTGRRQMCNS